MYWLSYLSKFRYIAPEQVPVQFGGLFKEDDPEFTTSDAVTELTIKPSSKETVEIPVTEVVLTKHPNSLFMNIAEFSWIAANNCLQMYGFCRTPQLYGNSGCSVGR
jgi:hypothetical protein